MSSTELKYLVSALLIASVGLLTGGCKEAPLTWVTIDMESSDEETLLAGIDEISVTLDPDIQLVDENGDPYTAMTVSDGLALEDADSDGVLEMRLSILPDADRFDALPSIGVEVEEVNTPMPFTLQAEGYK